MKYSEKLLGLFLIAVIFFSCEMKFPDEWDQPNWHLPINFPLQDEIYYFGGLVDSNTIFLDSTSTLHILFEDELLGPNGEYLGIDSTFDSYFRIDDLEFPNTIDGIVVDPIEINIPPLGFPVEINLSEFGDFSTFGCIPDEALNNIDPISEEITHVIDFSNALEYFNYIDSLTVTDGELSVVIENEFPFEISSFSINMYTANDLIWQEEILNLGEFDDITRSRPINENEPLVLKETILFQYEIVIDPQTGDDICGLENGWNLHGNFDRSLKVDFNLNFDEIGSVAGNLKEVNYEESYQIEITNSDEIFLSGGLLSYGNDINQLELKFTNDLFTDMDISLNILELFIFDSTDNDWTDSFNWNQTLLKNNSSEYPIFLRNSMLKPSGNQEDELESLNMIFSGFIPSQDIVLDPNIPYSFSIDTIEVKPIQMDYINAIFHEMEFSSPSISIDDVPEGFSGFKFHDVLIDLNIYNQIGVPVNLDMFIMGVQNDIIKYVPLRDSIYSPVISNGFSIGDVVHSNIKMTGSHQYSTWFDGNTIERQDTTLIPADSSFLEIMELAPNEITVGGLTELKGAGTLAPDTYIWGDFKLKLPLSFEFNDGMNIVPAITTEMNSMNEDSKNQIDEGLVSANLNVSIENHSALAMTLSLLVSTRDDYFPHYLDDLISGSLVTNQSFITSESEEDYEFLSSLNVSRIEVEPLSDDPEKALRVIFRDKNLNEIFWVGRIADITIPEAEEINSETGHVIKSGYGMDVVELSVEKMEWLTAGEKRYSRPMMEFVSSNGEPRTLRSTDYLKISSYVSLVLNTGGIND